MTMTMTALALLPALLASGAAPDDGAATERGGQRRQVVNPLRLVYLHSGAPAAGLEVSVVDERTGRASTHTSAADGSVPVPGGAVRVRVDDKARGLTLFPEAPVSEPCLKVPEAVRVRGRVAGAGAERTRIRLGDGPHEEAAERYRREALPDAMRVPLARSPLGHPLPPSPARWRDVALEAGAFTSDWIVAEEPPFVLAFDPAGRTALIEVPLPEGLAAGATLDAGTLTLRPPYALELRVELPAGSVSPAPRLRVSAAASAAQDEALRLASVLDQIDGRLFELFALGRSVTLPSSGRLELAGLPPTDSVTLELSDPPAGIAVERTLHPAPGRTRVQLGAAELGPGLRHAPGRVTGSLRVAGAGAPVAGATVVYFHPPERRETRTDAQGRFSLRGVPIGPGARVFVDARASRLGPGVVATQVFSGLDSSRPLRLELAEVQSASPGFGRRPETPPGPEAPQETCTNATTNAEYPNLAGQRQTESGAVFDKIKVLDGDLGQRRFKVQVARAGQWQFILAETAFVVYFGGATFENPNEPQWVVTGTAPNPTQEQRLLRFFRPNGAFAADVPVSFASFVSDPDPLELLTDDEGLIRLRCVNTNPIFVFVDSDQGCFDGDVNIANLVTSVTLKDAGTCGQ